MAPDKNLIANSLRCVGFLLALDIWERESFDCVDNISWVRTQNQSDIEEYMITGLVNFNIHVTLYTLTDLAEHGQTKILLLDNIFLCVFGTVKKNARIIFFLLWILICSWTGNLQLRLYPFASERISRNVRPVSIDTHCKLAESFCYLVQYQMAFGTYAV